MTRLQRVSLLILVGISLTAYAFGRGPFGFGESSSSSCPSGSCPTPYNAAPVAASPLVPVYSDPAPAYQPVDPPVQPLTPPSPPSPPTVTYRAVSSLVPAPVTPPPTATIPGIKPIGHWQRSVGPMTVELQGRDSRLNGAFRITADGTTFSVDFSIEYSVTADGLLYGVIQSADVDIPNLPADTDFEEIMGLKLMTTKLIDQPITMRCRVEDGTLTVKSFDLAIPVELMDEFDAESTQLLKASFIGRYPATPQHTARY